MLLSWLEDHINLMEPVSFRTRRMGHSQAQAQAQLLNPIFIQLN